MPGIPREKESEQLVSRLNNPTSQISAFHEIIRCGKATLHPLVKFSLSPPSIFSQPRCLAAEALGMIGGEEAILGLIEVLDLHNLDSLEPQVCLTEETVRDEAARQLGIFRDERASRDFLSKVSAVKENNLAHSTPTDNVFKYLPADSPNYDWQEELKGY
jgi:HEAT repeat protein